MEDRKYFLARSGNRKFTPRDLFRRFKDTYLFFKEQDYFKQHLEITSLEISKKAQYLSSIKLNAKIFPIDDWSIEMTKDVELIFSSIEFLSDHISEPGNRENFVTETGFNYTDYASYDSKSGQDEFRNAVNSFLSDYGDGYELNSEREIVKIGSHDIETILDAPIEEYDFDNVDLKVKEAKRIWKSRNATLLDKKKAILELADVFEWLRDTDVLQEALNQKDSNDLFNIINNFALRHHNQNQKNGYDENIWYAWMFHFFLATYHAVIRTIKNKSET